MTDMELRAFIVKSLNDGLANLGLPSVKILASNQPTSEGRVPGPAIYFSQPLPDERIGWQMAGFKRGIDAVELKESQYFGTTYQFTVVAPETDNLTIPTASDICRYASMILQSSQFIDALHKKEMTAGVRRVSQIRPLVIVNDEGQFEKTYSFDVQFTHLVRIVNISAAVDSAEYQIHRV